jgi:hypothetical protein
MVKGVVPDFVPPSSELGELNPVLWQDSILADHKKGNSQPHPIQKVEQAWKKKMEIRRKFLPSSVAMSLHIGPLIVEVKGEAG